MLFNARKVFNRRRAADDDLAVPKGLRAPAAQLDLIALAAGAWRVGVNLVKVNDPHRDPPKAPGAVGPHQDQVAAGIDFARYRVVGAAGFGIAHQANQGRGVAQHGRDFFLAVAFGIVHRGLHHHLGAGVMNDMIGHAVIDNLRIAHARAFQNAV